MKRKMNLGITIALLGLTVALLVTTTSDAGGTSPGTVNDPLVTKSYVDMKNGALEISLKTRIEVLEAKLASTALVGSGEGSEQDVTPQPIVEKDNQLFVVVEAKAGQRLICGASTEIILRAGSATVIAGEKGDGLANLTTGVDLRGEEVVPLQNHLLVSRNDGRGLLITSENGVSYILVKGVYTLE